MINEKWIVIDGSIFTEAEHLVKCELSDAKLKVRKSIAFNLKRGVAEYIVRMHNAAVKERKDGS